VVGENKSLILIMLSNATYPVTIVVIQVALVLFFLFAIMGVWRRFRAEELSLVTAVVWSFFWFLAGVVVLIPNSSAAAAKLVGIGRGADLVVYLSLSALFFIIFRLTIQLERLNRQLTQVVRAVALDTVLNKAGVLKK
jgi:small membrane protein